MDYRRHAGQVRYWKSIIVTPTLTGQRREIIWSIKWSRKTFDFGQNPYPICDKQKSSQKSQKRGELRHPRKEQVQNLELMSHEMARTEGFPSKVRNGTKMPVVTPVTMVTHTSLGAPATAIKREKEKQSKCIGKEESFLSLYLLMKETSVQKIPTNLQEENR